MAAHLSAVPDGSLPRKQVLSPADCRIILIKAASYDGRGVGNVEEESWYDAAVAQRWTSLELAIAAVIDYYSQPAKPGDRRWIMPGHVTEYIRAAGRQPAPMSERRFEIERARPATSEARATAIRKMTAALGLRKAIPSDRDGLAVSSVSSKDKSKARRAAREELRQMHWARVDGCELCDDEGISAAGVVCSHPER